MHSKSDYLKATINDKADEVIESLFESLKKDTKSMKVSEFVFNYVHLLYYKCHKINPNLRGSDINSSDCITNKKHQ